MFNSQIVQTNNGYKFTVTNNYGVTVYESPEKATEQSARKESLNFLYRGPNCLPASGGGSGDGSGNGGRRKPKPYVDANDN